MVVGIAKNARGRAPPPAIIGSSGALRQLCEMAVRVARSQHALLICGPSGAGKELIAQLVHQHGIDPAAPFVDVNCGAIPESLFESELFGAERGAYTGAVAGRRGHFAAARKGTLFLDEIGELPLSLQPKLLRVLETRRFRPLGASDSLPFEGRVIAATHRDLPAMIRAGSFREDLYYRLAVLVLAVPGLDQRRADIAELVAHFAARQPRHISFTAAALDFLCQRSWPGHVRELRNLVERLAVLAEAPLITLEVLQAWLPERDAALSAPPATPVAAALADALLQLDGENRLAATERLLLEHALTLTGGNKSAAAQLLGVSRKAVERRCGGHGVRTLSSTEAVQSGRIRPGIPAPLPCFIRDVF